MKLPQPRKRISMAFFISNVIYAKMPRFSRAFSVLD
jgi:hypothetical protein